MLGGSEVLHIIQYIFISISFHPRKEKHTHGTQDMALPQFGVKFPV